MRLIIAGARGAGLKAIQVVEDSREAERSDQDIIGFIDDNLDLKGTDFFGYPVLGTSFEMPEIVDRVGSLADVGLVCPIGDPTRRANMIERLSQWFSHFPNLIHPSAQISRRADIGIGNLFSQNVVLQAGTKVGNFNTFNIAAVMGPLAEVADYCTINANTMIASEARVSEYTYVGMGANILQRVVIGKHCKIGANSFVTRKLKDNSSVLGVPAKLIG